MGRSRVWNALRKIKPDRTPRGEILIEDGFLQQVGLSREALLEELQADIISLPIDYQSRADWSYWSQRDYFTFALINGPFNTLIECLGWPRASEWIVHNPAVSQRFMGKYLEIMYESAAAALEDGCEGLVLGDDLAGQNGLLVDPFYLRKHYFPELGVWLEKLQAGSVPILFHSDGNILEIIPDLHQLGFWGLHGLQPDAGMRYSSLPPELIKNWVWWGNFQFEGPRGLKDPLQLHIEARRLFQEWEAAPGYIFGSCSGLYPGLLLELVQAAYRS
jgi:uroporphyrinogen decarboxylase